MKAARPLVLAVLPALCACTAHAETLGVLTPEVPAALLVHTWEPVIPGPALFGSRDLRQARQQRRLEEWSQRDGFDLAVILTRHLHEALARPGRTTIAVPISWQGEQRVRGLSRELLPTDGRADLYLSLSALYVGLLETNEFASYQPALAVNYRWISGSGALVRNSRVVHYNRPVPIAEHSSASEAPVLYRDVPFLRVAEGCAFRSFDAVEHDTPRLWGCLDRAAAAIAAEIAKDVPTDTHGTGDLRSERSP